MPLTRSDRYLLGALLLLLAWLCSSLHSCAEPAKELQILDAIVHDVLTNPLFEGERSFYGTPGDMRFALVSSRGYGIAWPLDYHPSASGYSVCRVLEGENIDPDTMRLFGLRIDKFHLGQEAMPFNSPIEVTILNAGGSKNGGVLGGCSVYYSPKRCGDKWAVEIDMVSDP